MKITVKLILIIFFSIMYSQDVDLTGTMWSFAWDGAWGSVDPKGVEVVLLLDFLTNQKVVVKKQNRYNNAEFDMMIVGSWESKGKNITIQGKGIDFRISGYEISAVYELDVENNILFYFKEFNYNYWATYEREKSKTWTNWTLVRSSDKYKVSSYYFTDDAKIEREFINRIERKGKNRRPDLFQPKDEFETKKEYAQRLKKQEKIKIEIKEILIAEDAAKEQEEIRLAKEETRKRELEKKNKITQSLKAVELAVLEIGKYDAENETFPITVKGSSYTVNIPRSEARSFKENYTSAKVEGYKQLNENLVYVYFNLVVTHPITGNRFPFGPTRDIATPNK